MKTKFIEDRIDYTGKELIPHFAYRSFDILGDSLVAFCGGCNVKTDALVDLADAKNGDFIYSEEMLHFIGEFFYNDLDHAIMVQRLLIAMIKDSIAEKSGSALVRSGDDIFDGDAKISVSVATATPVSCMIHTGINIISENTPVKTKGLKDYGIKVKPFAMDILESFYKEIEGIKIARCKVRGVQ